MSFRLDQLAGALRRAKMIILCHPNNPNGSVFAPEDLEQIVWWANRRDVLILHDSAFAAYQYEGKPCKLAVSPQAEKRLLTIGGVSKSHALASARVGWLAGHRNLTGACTLLAATQAALVPTLCQQQALAALKLSPEVLEPIRQEFATRRQYTFDRLTAAGLRPCLPAGGFFFWLCVKQLNLTGRQVADRLLRDDRVLVWPGAFFGPSGKYHIRLSFAGDEGRLREGLSRVAECVRRAQTPAEVPTRQPWFAFRAKATAAVGNAEK